MRSLVKRSLATLGILLGFGVHSEAVALSTSSTSTTSTSSATSTLPPVVNNRGFLPVEIFFERSLTKDFSYIKVTTPNGAGLNLTESTWRSKNTGKPIIEQYIHVVDYQGHYNKNKNAPFGILFQIKMEQGVHRVTCEAPVPPLPIMSYISQLEQNPGLIDFKKYLTLVQLHLFKSPEDGKYHCTFVPSL